VFSGGPDPEGRRPIRRPENESVGISQVEVGEAGYREIVGGIQPPIGHVPITRGDPGGQQGAAVLDRFVATLLAMTRIGRQAEIRA
jgi:hypothetical protein